MFHTLRETKRGFTLIELLVVIAIIGILSSVVLASLGTARGKARDATRVSDIKNIQLALELYFDSNQEYPDTTQGLASLATGGYIPNIPTPPGPSSGYGYQPLNPAQPSTPPSTFAAADQCVATETCLSYALFVPLERNDNLVLKTDSDTIITTILNGTSEAVAQCDANAATPSTDELCYDVRP